MKRTVTAIALVALLAATPIIAQRGGQGARPPRGGERPGQMRQFQAGPAQALRFLDVNIIERTAEEIGLTETQIEEITKILTADGEKIKALEKEANDAAEAFKEALFAENYNEETAAKLLKTAQAKENTLTAAKLAVWAKIRPLLTAEQIAALGKTGNRHMGMRPGGPRGGRGERPAPPEGFEPPEGAAPPEDMPEPPEGFEPPEEFVEE